MRPSIAQNVKSAAREEVAVEHAQRAASLGPSLLLGRHDLGRAHTEPFPAANDGERRKLDPFRLDRPEAPCAPLWGDRCRIFAGCD